MKNLVVNGDDFGASRGINLGIIEAHQRGILTSASLMVDAPASAEAADLGRRQPTLGVGLHVVLEPPANSATQQAEVERQLQRFIELTGQRPTHIDTHHNVHREEHLLPVFRALAERYEVPLRGHCGVHHIAMFYGQWDGETHLEHVSPGWLARIFADELEEGFNELCCHPGYVDADLASSYSLERQTELATLCDPEIAALLSEHNIRLVTFREVAQP
jgi:chitin disaccharide deacetylase